MAKKGDGSIFYHLLKIMTPKNRTVPFFLFPYIPQVEQELDEQVLHELEFDVVEEEFPPLQNPNPLKILLIFLLWHFTQDILPSSISLMVARTSKIL